MAEIPLSSTVYGYLPSPGTISTVESKSLQIYGINFPVLKYEKDQHGRKKINKIFSKVTGHELTKCNLIQFINTTKGERVMRQEFGLNLNKFLFENIDGLLFKIIAREVFLQVGGYFPWLEIKSFSLFENSKIPDAQAVSLSITVKDPTWGIEIFDTKVSIR